MAIAGAIPVITDPSDLTDPFADTRTLALQSLDGTQLLPFQGREFFLLQGIEGIDMPPREVVTETYPGMEGVKIAEIRSLERDVFLPFFMGSDSSHLQYLNDRDALWRLFNYRTVDYAANDGTVDLVAHSRGEVDGRSLRLTYISGGESGHGTDEEGSDWASLGLRFLAARPYWEGFRWGTGRIYAPDPVPWFGAFPPALTSTRALGAGIPLSVTGDVPSWPRVDMMGPASSVTINAPGLSVSIPAGLADGEMATIDTDPRHRTAMFGGDVDWSRVAPTDRYRALEPGETWMDVLVVGAEANSTYAVVSGSSLWERPW